jgi:hypothetical protein
VEVNLKQIIRILALLFVSISSPAQKSSSADHADAFTFELANGRYWISLKSTTGGQGDFMCGLASGWDFRGTTDLAKGSVIAATQGRPKNCDELAELVTAGYVDPANRDLPIGWVFLAELAIKRGETTPDRVFPALRQLVSKILNADPTNFISLDPIPTIIGAATK